MQTGLVFRDGTSATYINKIFYDSKIFWCFQLIQFISEIIKKNNIKFKI